MFALSIFIIFMTRPASNKSKAIHHYFNTMPPEGHVPHESEIAYWQVELPDSY